MSDGTRIAWTDATRKHTRETRAAPDMTPWCQHCGQDYPCPTVRAVDEIERLSVALAWYRAYAPLDECERWLGLSRDEIMFLLDTATEQGIELIEYARREGER